MHINDTKNSYHEYVDTSPGENSHSLWMGTHSSLNGNPFIQWELNGFPFNSLSLNGNPFTFNGIPFKFEWEPVHRMGVEWVPIQWMGTHSLSMGSHSSLNGNSFTEWEPIQFTFSVHGRPFKFQQEPTQEKILAGDQPAKIPVLENHFSAGNYCFPAGKHFASWKWFLSGWKFWFFYLENW